MPVCCLYNTEEHNKNIVFKRLWSMNDIHLCNNVTTSSLHARLFRCYDKRLTTMYEMSKSQQIVNEKKWIAFTPIYSHPHWETAQKDFDRIMCVWIGVDARAQVVNHLSLFISFAFVYIFKWFVKAALFPIFLSFFLPFDLFLYLHN